MITVNVENARYSTMTMITADHLQLTLGYSTEACRRMAPMPLTAKDVFKLELSFLNKLKVLLHETVLAKKHVERLALDWANYALQLAAPWQRYNAVKALHGVSQYLMGEASEEHRDASIKLVDVTREIEYLAIGAALRGHAWTCARWMLDPKAEADKASTEDYLRDSILLEISLRGN